MSPADHALPSRTHAVEEIVPDTYDAIIGSLRDAPSDRPFVIGQLGQSLDGRIATMTGCSRYINGEAALDHLHLLRANVDAVLVGAGTVVADDPQLNVRRAPGRNPARVVLDPGGRTPALGRWLAGDGARRCIISAVERPAPEGCDEVIVLPRENGVISQSQIVAALFERGFRRILVEGGARTIAGFIETRALDRLHVLVAPVIIGSGKQGLDLAPISELSDALRPSVRVWPFPDGDVLFDCDLKG
jgi:diaminohydroxyphosphoribosylaminopyrimidine deaminase / 5-amino-6-(5-phosphoribosylamino)uracil reductase